MKTFTIIYWFSVWFCLLMNVLRWTIFSLIHVLSDMLELTSLLPVSAALASNNGFIKISVKYTGTYRYWRLGRFTKVNGSITDISLLNRYLKKKDNMLNKSFHCMTAQCNIAQTKVAYSKHKSGRDMLIRSKLMIWYKIDSKTLDDGRFVTIPWWRIIL